MINTHGVLHFTIPVKDMDRAEKFYKDVFGFERVRRNKHMIFMQSVNDNFVLTYSENPVDPNPVDGTAIHSAFRVTPQEYDRAMKFWRRKASRSTRKKTGTQARFRAGALILRILTGTCWRSWT